MGRDTSMQSDISKGNPTTNNGAFNRAASSFRNTVQKDGQYTPEAGLYRFRSFEVFLAFLTSFYR